MFNKIIEYFTHKDRDMRDNRWVFSSMLVGAIFSLLAAFVLSIDAITLAKNPNAVFSCDINAIISCGIVAKTSFVSLFGFPNSFLGLISAPVVITVAVAGLAGIKFPRWFMFVAQIIYSIGFLFAYYLFFIGLFVVQAICPWCLLVTLATTFVWFSITRYNIRENNLFLNKKIAKQAKDFINKDYDKFILALVVVAVIVVLILRYGNALFV
jgi:uncharacterized membrane protein